jgi:hypothetical protein
MAILVLLLAMLVLPLLMLVLLLVLLLLVQVGRIADFPGITLIGELLSRLIVYKVLVLRYIPLSEMMI